MYCLVFIVYNTKNALRNTSENNMINLSTGAILQYVETEFPSATDDVDIRKSMLTFILVTSSLSFEIVPFLCLWTECFKPKSRHINLIFEKGYISTSFIYINQGPYSIQYVVNLFAQLGSKELYISWSCFAWSCFRALTHWGLVPQSECISELCYCFMCNSLPVQRQTIT